MRIVSSVLNFVCVCVCVCVCMIVVVRYGLVDLPSMQINARFFTKIDPFDFFCANCFHNIFNTLQGGHGSSIDLMRNINEKQLQTRRFNTQSGGVYLESFQFSKVTSPQNYFFFLSYALS